MKWQLDERGATAVEYALMVGLVALAIVFVVGLFGTTVGNLFVADWPWN